MSLFFITGISGSGKSEVTRELKARSYEAYDTDDDGLAKWQNNETGYIHPKSSVKQESRTDDFLHSHSWNVSRQDVIKLAERAKDKPIFLCGVADNAHELLDLFSKVFALAIDGDTLKHRLETRTGNNWGKQPHELQWSLKQQESKNKAYRNAGFTIIDAAQPVRKVVDGILKNATI